MFGYGSRDIETGVNRLYKAFKSTAVRYHYTFQRPVITVGGRPNVVFLGNHSSGKSSAINELLGDPPVQDTGVAPTDDSFTVLLFGDTEQDYYGPAAVGQLPAEFASIVSMGPAFLQHLQVKFRKREYLRHVNLIDSPGMIDTAEGKSRRDYDFAGAVRNFAEISDLVFFLFDPDKPGTTSETVYVLSDCMFGIEFKLRVLLNKSDTFDSMYDFARAYGTLCWNLARVLRMKDLPTIYTTYTPRPESRINAKIDLNLFDKHRGELLDQLRNVTQRRFDSMLANVNSDFIRLAIQSRVLASVSRKLVVRRLRQVGVFVVLSLLAFLASWFLATHVVVPDFHQDPTLSWRRLLAFLFTGAVTGGTCLVLIVCAHFGANRLRMRIASRIDGVFEEEYAATLAIGARDDLRQYWNAIRADVVAIVNSRARLPLLGWSTRRRLDEAVLEIIPGLIAKSRPDIRKGG